MEKVKFVFCVLVYRNTKDIKEFIVSVKINVTDFKIIIINSYYDEESMSEFRKIAEDNQCDFINIPNKGYGYGNNRGIEFANNHYNYDYLIISNPDIIIKQFPEQNIYESGMTVIAPEIKTLTGKHQNPMIVWDLKLSTEFIYKGMKQNNKLFLRCGLLVNKIIRMVALNWEKLKRNGIKTYQIHGSFFILRQDILDQIGIPYDENMFLFAEEAYLAYLLKQKNITSYYCSKIKVEHKEEGSMSFRDDINELCKKSCIYFYEKYYFKE